MINTIKKNHYDDRVEFIKKITEKTKNNFFGYKKNPVWGAKYFEEISKCNMGINITRGKPIKYYSSERMATLLGNGILTFEHKDYHFQDFFNNSPLGPSNMSVLFTEKIKDYFERNTSLEIVDENGDLEIEGTIENFSLSPVAPTAEGGRNAQYFTGLTRLTVRVNASYLNKTDEQFNFENKSFSFYKDFDQNTEELSSNEQEFVEEIFDQIVLDIFNSSVANW